ncbi:hypothetical protein JCM3775_006026 [Rhodotorula graminis]
MPDTDYDDLPSPPRARSHSRTGAAGAAGRLYGRKAARKPVGGSAHHGGGGGASGEEGSGGESSPSVEARSVGGGSQRSSRSSRSQGAARGQGGRAGKVTRRGKEREADEESDEGNDDEVGLGIAPGGRSRVKGKLHTARPSSSLTAVRPSSSSIFSLYRSGDNGGATSDRVGRAKRTATEEDEQEQNKRSRSSAASSQRARSPRSSSTFSSPRKRALGDKSNLTADSPRKASRARPSQLVLPGPSSTTSSSRSPRASASSLGVFRDQPSTSAAVHPASSSSSHLAPPPPIPPSTAQSASRARPPRAALAVTAHSMPHRAPTFSTSLARSTSPDLSGARGALNPPPSPRAPQPASPARLGVPGGSRPSLGAPGMPAPWALAAPAGQHSSSPRRAHEPVVEHGAPVFRYTTSEFDDAPSLQLSLGDGGAAEDDGAGMESSIVLETWEDEQSRRSEAREPVLEGLLAEGAEHEMADDEGGSDDEVGDMTLRPGAGLLDVSASEEMPMDDDMGAAQGGDAAERDDEESELGADDLVLVGRAPKAREPVVAPNLADEDDGDATIKAPSRLARRDEPAQALDDAQQPAAPDSPDQHLADHFWPARTSSSSSSSSTASPRRRPVKISFSASLMPPRRPRLSVDKPLEDGPLSDEDPLGYALRTTATYSSEDDLADSAPSDESALEDYLAEREVGRAVKPTSGQRDKRVAASARARRLRLVDGAREGLERKVLDVDEADMRGALRRLLEARAEGADEQEEEALKAWHKQKKQWVTGRE